MAAKDKERYNAYMAEYMIKRYHRRRQEGMTFLGGKCCKCGTTENLEFDHIDRELKAFNISKQSSCSEEKFWTEIKKCQLLCKEHHLEKSYEYGDLPPLAKCGENAMYRKGCRCDPCRKARADVVKEAGYGKQRRTCSVCRIRTMKWEYVKEAYFCKPCAEALR